MATLSDVLFGVRCAFFPRRCPFCGRLIPAQQSVCGRCAGDLERVPLPICYSCGRSRIHCVCGRGHDRFAAAFASPFYYLGQAKNAVLRMKFRNEPETAQVFGAQMASFARRVYDGVAFDLVTFVPMTDAERKRRGFNQSELLALHTAQMLSLPCEDVLCKIYETARQHDLSRRMRSGNVLGVFDVHAPDVVRDKRILLCDDVCTSGTTLSECAKMLCLYGAREVFCLSATVSFPYAQVQKKG